MFRFRYLFYCHTGTCSHIIPVYFGSASVASGLCEAIPKLVGDCSPALQQTQCGASVGKDSLAMTFTLFVIASRSVCGAAIPNRLYT